MDYTAVRAGQGVPQERPLRGALQILAILALALLTTLGAFLWMTRNSLRRTPIDESILDLTQVFQTIEPALATYAGKLPIRLLTDPTQTLALTDGPIARDIRDFLRSQGVPTSTLEALPKHDPWGHSFVIDVQATESGKVRATCSSAGPNGIFESKVADAAEGDDVQITREQS